VEGNEVRYSPLLLSLLLTANGDNPTVQNNDVHFLAIYVSP